MSRWSERYKKDLPFVNNLNTNSTSVFSATSTTTMSTLSGLIHPSALSFYSKSFSSLSALGSKHFTMARASTPSDYFSGSESDSLSSSDESSSSSSDLDMVSGTLSSTEDGRAMLSNIKSLSFVDVRTQVMSQVFPQFTKLVSGCRLASMNPTRRRVRTKKQAHQAALKIGRMRVSKHSRRPNVASTFKHRLYKVVPAQPTTASVEVLDDPHTLPASSPSAKARTIPTFEDYDSGNDTSREGSPEPSSRTDFTNMMNGTNAAATSSEKLSPKVTRSTRRAHFVSATSGSDVSEGDEHLFGVSRTLSVIVPSTSSSALGKRSRSRSITDDADEGDDELSASERPSIRRKISAYRGVPGRSPSPPPSPALVTPPNSPAFGPIHIVEVLPLSFYDSEAYSESVGSQFY